MPEIGVFVCLARADGRCKYFLGDFDAVIVDFGDVQAADVLAILRARPDLKIVGVNATNSAVTVLSGRIYLAHTLADVVGCLE